MSDAAGPATPRTFWLGLLPGVALMGWGVRLYLDATPDLARRLDLAGWLVGADLVHDLLVAPVVVAVGVLVTRYVRARWLGPVQAALIASGSVVLVGLLPLLDTAAVANNATIQPLDYAPSIAAVVVAIWLAAGLAGFLRRRR